MEDLFISEKKQEEKQVYFLFPPLVKLIKVFQAQLHKELPPEDARIRLNEMVSRLSFWYEKLRNAVDYQDEHLLRERAILRNLQRTMTLPNRSGRVIARPLVYDLIRAGYLPNNTLPENIVSQAEKIIDRYIRLIDIIGHYKEKEEKVEIFDFLIKMLAIELDDLFVDKAVDDALIECMYQAVSKDIIVEGNYTEVEKKIQLYVAILRSLMKADAPRIHLYLWQLYVSEWQHAGEKELIEIAQKIDYLREQIEQQVSHQLNQMYMRVLRKYNVIFLIIRDIISEDPDKALDIWKDPELLEEKIRQAARKRYKESRVKLRRSIVRSIIYLFITKMTLAIILELPLDLMLERTVNYFSLTINIIFPPLLMFAIGLFIRVPGVKNTDKIVQGIKEISYQLEERRVIHKVKKPFRRSVFMTRAFRVMYSVLFSVVFGGIIYGLHRFGFNIASIVIFIFFLCLVSFFGIRISQSARELYIVERKDNLFTFLKDFATLPIIEFGRWLSLNLSKVNFFVILFDFVIEAPFKVILDVVDQWTSYVKEKREELL